MTTILPGSATLSTSRQEAGRKALSMNTAVSTSTTTRSPGDTFLAPLARARIFSMMVMPMSSSPVAECGGSAVKLLIDARELFEPEKAVEVGEQVAVRRGWLRRLSRILGLQSVIIIPHRPSGGAECPAGIGDETDAEAAEFVKIEHRRDTGAIVVDRCIDGADEASDLVGAQLPLWEDHVGAGVEISLRAAYRLLEAAADGAACVGARHQYEIPVKLVTHPRCAADLGHRLGERKQLLTLNMTTALRFDLILDEKAAGARLDDGVDRSHRIERIAVTGIGIDHYRNRYRLADVAADARRFAHGYETDIGFAEHADRDAIARDADHLESGALQDLGR